jgi:hypothetical protein
VIRADVVRCPIRLALAAKANEMSRAFIKEVEQEIDELPDRSVSPHPSLVTAEGLAAIEGRLAVLKQRTKLP